MIFKPVSLAVAALAGGSIFLLTPFVVSSAAVEEEGGEHSQHHLRSLSTPTGPVDSDYVTRVQRWLDTSNVCPTNASVTQSPGNGCMDAVGGISYGCTAEDVRVAGTELLEVLQDGELLVPNNGSYVCDEGADLELDFYATLVVGASIRYDIGAFWALEGGDARLGANCSYTSFTNEELRDEDGEDNCGDLSKKIQDGIYPNVTVCGLKAKCEAGETGKVTVNTCTTWKVKGNNIVCDNNDPTTYLPGQPSKCKCEDVVFDIEVVTASPSSQPSETPTASPSSEPSSLPSATPSESPSSSPSSMPSSEPTCDPPELSCPDNSTVSCAENIDIPFVNATLTTETCGNPTLDFECCADTVDGVTSIIRTWTLKYTTEKLGTEVVSSCSQFIEIECFP